MATGTDNDVDNGAMAAGTMADIAATDDLDLYFEYTNILVLTNIGLTTHHLVAEIELEITSVFDFIAIGPGLTLFHLIGIPVTNPALPAGWRALHAPA